MKKIIGCGLGVITTLVALGLSQNISANVSIVPLPEKQSNSEIRALVESRFANLDKSDKILPVDGGYLYGEAEEIPMANGIADKKDAQKFSSKTDTKSITVASAIEIEVKKAENGLGAGSVTPFPTKSLNKGLTSNSLLLNFQANKEKFTLLDAYVPTKIWSLHWGSSYRSGGFGGSGWIFAGYRFVNNEADLHLGTGQTWAQVWSTYGDSGNVGDMGDAYTTYNTRSSAGVPVYPGSRQNIWPTDGSIYLTFMTYNPISGSGYVVENNSH
jgi:hypothetical protein